MTGERINLLVLSPDPNLAGVLAAAVSHDPTFEVLGTAPEPGDLDDMVQRWTPTVTVVSLALPGSLDMLASIDPRTATLALDQVEDPKAMLDALESGADGYAVMEEGLDNLIDAIRAVASDPVSAGLVAINVARASAFAFALGGALTAAGGALLSTFYTFHASIGVTFTMKALIIVIMGGVGDIRGAVLAALLLGLVETAVSSLIDPGLTLAATYLMFVLVLLLRPQGIFGRQAV